MTLRCFAIIALLLLKAPLAQLDRASGYEPEGREFESLRAHHLSASLPKLLLPDCYLWRVLVLLTMTELLSSRKPESNIPADKRTRQFACGGGACDGSPMD